MRFAQSSLNKLTSKGSDWIQSMLIRREPKLQSKLYMKVALVQSKAFLPEVTWPNERVYTGGPCLVLADMKEILALLCQRKTWKTNGL